MTYDVMGPRALNYLPCRYGTSKLLFRGPKRELKEPYVAFVGGTETYGKFIDEPFPARVENDIGTKAVNFGISNAGLDAFIHDPFVLQAAAQSQVTVLQVMGAQNMTNRFYSVHPRRNDRFVTASTVLRTIYRDVDFSEFHFNKHMLKGLMASSSERFEVVKIELQRAWVARMRLIIRQIGGKVILLWFADHRPQEDGHVGGLKLGNDPLFITRQMISEVGTLATRYVEVPASAGALAAGTAGMLYNELEAPAARLMLGPEAHAEAANAVTAAIGALL